ncbi:response regulator transcription factor [Microvirga subterranea]|uniref:Two-component system nitrate/nitrite response regulator NarL n=1 Tax=Microvirga subterranea TaxID=186651 RepID=A0A370HH87_9HYPH|nr:response regulator transcription factor [Microvirga subterranea]RDI56817.1 two-component system nitrate/nitrite response regulator NarL [Microvirga subterranea]
MTEVYSVIAADLPATSDSVRDLSREVPTALISESPLLQAGLEHLLADTRFVVGDHAAQNRPDRPSPELPHLFIIISKQCSNRTIESVETIKATFRDAKICVMADDLDLSSALRAYEAGANGFCLTSVDRDVLTTSLDLMMMGEGLFPSRLLASASDHIPSTPDREAERPFHGGDQSLESMRAAGPTGQRLSAREGEILRGLMEGAPNKVIARQFGLSEATVKVHVKAILRKIGAKNRTQAAMWAADHIPASRTTTLS